MDVNSADNLPATRAQADTRPHLIRWNAKPSTSYSQADVKRPNMVRRNAEGCSNSIFVNGNVPRQRPIILSPPWPPHPSTILAVDPAVIFPKRAVLSELNIPWFEVELLPCGSLEFSEWVSDIIWDRMFTEGKWKPPLFETRWNKKEQVKEVTTPDLAKRAIKSSTRGCRRPTF